jgi:hypothetical protein
VVIDAAVLVELRQAQRAMDKKLNKLQQSIQNLFITPVQQRSPYCARNWISRSPETNRLMRLQANRILLVTIHESVYPITTEVLQQVFSSHGYLEKIEIMPTNIQVQAYIHFQLLQDAIRARNELQGCNIYDGCCRLEIQFSSLCDLNEPDVETQEQDVQVLAPKSTQSDALDEVLSGNPHLKTDSECVNEVNSDLLSTEQPINSENVANVLVEHKDSKILANYIAAHMLFDKMSQWETIPIGVSPKVRADLGDEQDKVHLPKCGAVTQEQAVQVLNPNATQMETLNARCTAKILRNRHFQPAAAFAAINEVIPSLIHNNQPLSIISDAFVSINDSKHKKFEAKFDAYELFDEMPKSKTLLYKALVQVKDHLYFFLPNFVEILAKNIGSINGIEIRSVPLIFMSSFLVVHDPGGNNQVFDDSEGDHNRQNKMTQMLIKYGDLIKHMCAAIDSLKAIGRDELHASFGSESELLVVNRILLAGNIRWNKWARNLILEKMLIRNMTFISKLQLYFTKESVAFHGTTCKLEMYFVQFVFDPGGFAK